MNALEEKTLSNQEIQVLVSIMSSRSHPNDLVRGQIINEMMESANFNKLTTNMAILRLLQKQMILEDENILAYSLTSEGENWLLDNEYNLPISVVTR